MAQRDTRGVLVAFELRGIASEASHSRMSSRGSLIAAVAVGAPELAAPPRLLAYLFASFCTKEPVMDFQKRTALLIASLLFGCGEPSSSNAGDGSTAPPDGGLPRVPRDAGPPPPSAQPVDCEMDEVASFAGVVTTVSDRTPIAGARVCVLEHSEIPCATTDANGSYELGCAPLGDAAISFEAEGFATGVWQWGAMPTAVPRSLDISLARQSVNSAYLAPTGLSYPNGVDSLITLDLNGQVQGLTGRIVVGQGDGPFFSTDETARIDPTITSATSDRELMFFVGYAYAGWSEVEIELQPPAGVSCEHFDGAWESRSGQPNRIRVLVHPDWETVAWIRCS